MPGGVAAPSAAVVGMGSTHLSLHRQQRNVLSLWKWELLCLSGSVAALTSIITVLLAFEDKDLSAWKAPVSINAMVAILSALFKGTPSPPLSEGISHLKWLWFSDKAQKLADMDVYDRASRGARGSARLISQHFHGPQRSSKLAAYGAVITVLLLALDPFIQALVAVDTCQSILPDPATIPRTNHYSDRATAGGPNIYDPSMQIAVLEGVYRPAKNSSVSLRPYVRCQTGNCTFSTTNDMAAFSTLSMCHACVDKSSSVINHGDDGLGYKVYTLDDYHNGTMHVKDWIDSEVPFNITVLDEMPRDSLVENFPDGLWERTNLANFRGLSLAPTNQTCHQRGCERTPFAFECGFRPCVKSYIATMAKDVYSEYELDTQFLHWREDGKFFELAANKAAANETWFVCDGQTERSIRHTAPAILPKAQSLPSLPDSPNSSLVLWYPDECYYSVDNTGGDLLALHLGHAMRSARLYDLDANEGTRVEGDAWALKLWNSGAPNMSLVEDFARGIATAISAQFRISDGAGTANGHSLQLRPCIRVKWGYISFLAVLFAGDAVFFLAVVIFSRRSFWGGDWKSSTLPLLSQSIAPLLDKRKDKEDGEKECEQALYDSARTIDAIFVPDGTGARWNLVRERGEGTE